MWLILIGLTAYQATSDCAQHIDNFLAGPTTTKVTLFYNETMSFFVDPTLCVEINIREMSIEYFDAQNSTAVRQFLSNFDNISDVGEFLAKTVMNSTKEVKILLGLTAKMVANIISLETLAPDDPSLDITKGGEIAAGKQLAMQDTLVAIQEFYALRQTNFTDLVYTVGVYLCLRMSLELTLMIQYKVGSRNRPTFASVCDRRKLAWIGSCPFDSEPAQLCFYLNKEFILFERASDSIRITSRPDTLYSSSSVLPEKPFNIYVDFDSNRVVSDVSSPVTVSVGDQQDLFLQLLGYYKSLPSKQVKCNNIRGGDNFMDCRGRCKASTIMNYCGCWPLSWSGLSRVPANVPKCSSGLPEFQSPYLNRLECLQNITTFYDPDQSCTKSCMRKCEASVFTLSLTSASNPIDKKFTAVTMALNRFDYADYEEIPMNTWNTFLSRIGGSLGLWLGANFLGLYHVIFFIMRSFVEQSVAVAFAYNRKKTAKIKISRQSSSINDGTLQTWRNFSTVSTMPAGPSLSVPTSSQNYSPRVTPRDNSNLDRFLAEVKSSEPNAAMLQLLEQMVERLKSNATL